MSKFILPTQKGLELFPNTVVAAPIIRWAGVDPSSVDAQHVLEVFGSALTSFYAQQSQNHSLSLNTQSKATRQIAPGLVATYVNQGGIEYITIWVQPSSPSEARKEAELQLTEPSAPIGKCLMVLYDGNKIAAIPMGQLSSKKFSPAYTKELSESSWSYNLADDFYLPSSLQYPPGPNASHSGVWLGPASFTDTRVSFEAYPESRCLLEPSHPAGGVSVGVAYVYPLPSVLAVTEDIVHTPVVSYKYTDGEFVKIEDRSASDAPSPTATANDGTRYYYGQSSFAQVWADNYYKPTIQFQSQVGFSAEMSQAAYPRPFEFVVNVGFDDNVIPLAHSNSYYAEFDKQLVNTSEAVGGILYKDFYYYYTNPAPTTTGPLSFPHPVPAYDPATLMTDVMWVPFDGTAFTSSVANGTAQNGQTIYKKSINWIASGLNFSSSGSRTTADDELVSYGAARINLLSFPPALYGTPFANIELASAKHVFVTPYETGDGSIGDPRFFCASKSHVFCAYTVSPATGGVVHRAYLDGVDVYTEFADALGTEYDRIALVMMDVPLEVIKKFK